MLKRIRDLRFEGKSLKEIAIALNKSSSTVKRYLKKNNIRLIDFKMKCQYCGCVFLPEDAKHRYCCRECALKSKQDKSNKKKHKMYNMNDFQFKENKYVISYNRDQLNTINVFVCHECGSKEFISDYKRNERYCGNCGVVLKNTYRLD